jgi:hypothetical protein
MYHPKLIKYCKLETKFLLKKERSNEVVPSQSQSQSQSQRVQFQNRNLN